MFFGITGVRRLPQCVYSVISKECRLATVMLGHKLSCYHCPTSRTSSGTATEELLPECT